MTIHDEGDALQGDVCLFRIPDHIKIDTSDEITPNAGGCRPATISEIECLREITRLRAENEAMRGALEKIASVEVQEALKASAIP